MDLRWSTGVINGINDKALNFTVINVPNAVNGVNVVGIDNEVLKKITAIVEFTTTNETMKVVEGDLYSVDGTILYRYAPAKDATSFTVPEGVTTIGDCAFANATNLTEVIISKEVVTVGNEMFFGTTNVVVKVEASAVSANYPNDWAKYAKDVVYDYLTGDDDDNIVEF